MRVLLLDEVLEIQNNVDAVDELLLHLDEQLDKKSQVLSFMLIDGVEVYEDYREYLIDRLNEIIEVKICGATVEQMGNEALTYTSQYIDRACPEVEALSSEFYQGPGNKSWIKFSQLMEGLGWIHQMIHSLDKLKRGSIKWGEFVSLAQKIEETTLILEEAVNNKDSIYIGDILKYEILPVLSELKLLVGGEITSGDSNLYVN